jgi:DNA-directed RNA polymerase subunit beta'
MTPAKCFVDKGTNIKEAIANMELNTAFAKSHLSQMIAQIYKRYHTTETSIMLDKLKDLGFKHSTLSGISIAISDIKESVLKPQILKESQEVVDQINKQFRRGLITDEERSEKVIEVWTKAKKDVENEIAANLKEDKDNPLSIMLTSKARGDLGSFNQLLGMRGLFAKPSGGFIEIPVKSSFSQGVTIAEFFLSTHGTRKGAVDTALKTAEAGYLTRRLVDVVQDVIVKEEDCQTDEGIIAEAFMKDNEVIEPLEDRIVGRYTSKRVINPETKEVIIDKNVYITEQLAEKVIKAKVDKVPIRSVLTCKTETGVCQRCYGRNLATGSVVEVGEAVGIMAAQSIGEPGTQLTMRTFNTGGVSGGDDITQGLPRVEELFEARNPKGKATISEINGVITDIDEEGGRFIIKVKNDAETKEHITMYGTKLLVNIGDEVKAGQRFNNGAISPKELLAVTDPITVQQYILSEIQKVYRSQGVDVSDKHVEIMARRMISRVKVVDSGDSLVLTGTTMGINKFTDLNRNLILDGKKPAKGKSVLLGITKVSLETESFLSAASFQETTRILTDAALHGKVDHLLGLKENVIIGKLIPAGTGAKKYRKSTFDLELDLLKEEPLEALEQELMD